MSEDYERHLGFVKFHEAEKGFGLISPKAKIGTCFFILKQLRAIHWLLKSGKWYHLWNSMIQRAHEQTKPAPRSDRNANYMHP
jgi:hypothetical protein